MLRGKNHSAIESLVKVESLEKGEEIHEKGEETQELRSNG
jgi:hypothetical protein